MGGSHRNTKCLKGAISHVCVFGLKGTEGNMRFLKMIQRLGGCHLVKIPEMVLSQILGYLHAITNDLCLA